MKAQQRKYTLGGFILFISCLLFLYSFAYANQPTDNKPSDNKSTDNKANTKKSANGEKSTSQKKELGHFTSVSLSGLGDLYIKQSKEENFTVETPDEVLPLVIVYVKDGVLYIDVKEASKHSEAKINYYLNVKELQKVTSFSSSNVYIKEGLEGKSFDLSIGNLGEANIRVTVDKLNARIDSGGQITLHGSAKEQNYTINGAGEINANNISGKIATATIKGSGSIVTEVTEKLSANINGDGVVKYCGNPDISRNITGKGKIEALSEKECNK